MNKTLFLILICFFNIIVANAQDVCIEEDISIRENPDISVDSCTSAQLAKIDYDYIKIDKNNIIYNGADWSQFYDQLNNADFDTISIVHIGDSHLQADIATGYTRNLLQHDYGSAGRGLVIPFKMAKTNEPRDYAITSLCRWNATKAIKQRSDSEMGFTGISISPISKDFDLTISTLSRTTTEPFSNVRLYHSGTINIDSIITANNNDSTTYNYYDRYIDINLGHATTEVTLKMNRTTQVSIFGAVLSNSNSGIIYHTIGNNGATYDTYNRIGHIGKDIASLKPSLVILSLGANEAFGRISTVAFQQTIHTMVQNVREDNPQAQILLVTPMECHKRRYIRRKGRRRRRGYIVNEKILTLRNEILRYGKENNIAVYDWYDIAGGKGAANLWLNDKLMSRDHIHNTATGYKIQGQLLYEALTKDINSHKTQASRNGTNSTMADNNI